ncbi:MAG: sugar phosphate isomerase/epimerase family protein [Runella sp.]
MKTTFQFITFLVSLFLGGLLLISCEEKPKSPQIALQLYSFRNQFAQDVPGTMAKVQALGVKYVELAGTYNMTVPDFLALLKKHDLTPIGTGVDFDVLDKNPQQAVADAKTLGVKYVVCFWIPHQDTIFTIEEVNKAVEVFNRAGKLLKENGFSFCYHPHGYEFRPYENGMLFDVLAQKLDPQYVNFEMDTYWVKHPGQDPVAVLQKYPTRFPILHVKDRQVGTIGNQNGRGDVETNVTLGTGDVGIEAIVKEAAKIGAEYLVIEDESSRSETQVPQSITYLQGILKTP